MRSLSSVFLASAQRIRSLDQEREGFPVQQLERALRVAFQRAEARRARLDPKRNGASVQAPALPQRSAAPRDPSNRPPLGASRAYWTG